MPDMVTFLLVEQCGEGGQDIDNGTLVGYWYVEACLACLRVFFHQYVGKGLGAVRVTQHVGNLAEGS